MATHKTSHSLIQQHHPDINVSWLLVIAHITHRWRKLDEKNRIVFGSEAVLILINYHTKSGALMTAMKVKPCQDHLMDENL